MTDNTTPALNALLTLASLHQISLNGFDILHKYAHGKSDLALEDWLLAAKAVGLKAKLSYTPQNRLPMVNLPALIWRDDGCHAILARCQQNSTTYQDNNTNNNQNSTNQTNISYLVQYTATGETRLLDSQAFFEFYEGKLILVSSRAFVLGGLAKFDFTWFIPAIIKYRKLLLEVLFISVVLQLFALITPLFFQVVMDKVLVHQGFSTLDVIAIALLVVGAFEVVLGGLRTYIFAHTTSRIDVELGARLFRHMLSLPQAYFEKRRVGDTVARMRELEQIRNFLTGQALTSLLDFCFVGIFLVVMWYYSPKLTLIVLASLPAYGLWSAFISPILRHRLDDKFAKNANNQAFLVESVTAVNTIKALAIEPVMVQRWDKQLASYVAASFKTTHLATIGQSGIQLIQKLVVVASLWLGAHLVIAGQLTIGQLIAFNMLAGQVAAPVIRLAQLWQDFQQVGISVARLGDILNTPTENPNSQLALPAIQGNITFKQVNFRYHPNGVPILNHINLNIQAGQVVGIVGRSGSGKSTLTRLIQRLYVPESGQILIDGQDIALVDTTWLRRQIGVVLQENTLFNASIRDNIAITHIGITTEQVVAAAKMAGAHEFISELPEGYNTIVGEQGAGLSGGQRQRIAIARALLTNPRILILDEATSALDYESEHIIMQQMHTICQGRTVLIIAHRLSTVRRANYIVAMDKGRIVEIGTHEALLQKENGYYRYLYHLQAQ